MLNVLVAEIYQIMQSVEYTKTKKPIFQFFTAKMNKLNNHHIQLQKKNRKFSAVLEKTTQFWRRLWFFITILLKGMITKK